MNTKTSMWLAAASASAIIASIPNAASAQSRSEWQQHNGPAQYANVNSRNTKEMFTAVAPPRPEDAGWFAPTNTNGYFVNTSSTVTCNRQVDYTYFQTSFVLSPGNTLEMLELRFAHDNFDDGGMVIVNGDKAKAIYVDKGSQTSVNLAGQIRQGANRIVVAQADNCKVLNKVPAMDLIYKVRGGEIQVAKEDGELETDEPMGGFEDDEPMDVPQAARRAPVTEPLLTSRGDVHISTNDGLKYDYQGVGDFIGVLDATSGALLIVARQRPWEGKPAASVNKAVALGVGQDKVEFFVQPKRLLVNGVEKKLGAQKLPAGGRIAVVGRDDYYVHWPKDAFITRVVVRSQAIDYGYANKGNAVQGLLGNSNGNPRDDMQIRGGAVLATPPSAADLARFGESWRMQSNVFTVPHPEGNAPQDGLVAGAKLSTAERSAAERKCRDGGVTSLTALKDCAYDVAVTGSAEFIESAKAYEKSVAAQPTAPRIVAADAEPQVTLKQVNAWPANKRFTLQDIVALGFEQETPTVKQAPAPAAGNADSVFPVAGEFFFLQGQKYYSPSGNHYLIFQNDGNLVIYTSADGFVWGLNEQTNNYSQTVMVTKQKDGNLVAYTADRGYVWSARDVASPDGTKLYFEASGQLALVDPAGNKLWSSK